MTGATQIAAAIWRSASASAWTLPPPSEKPQTATASGVDLLAAPGVGERGAPVLPLAPGIHQVARLAAAVAEVAVVEGEDREAGGGEVLGEGVEALAADAAEARSHHHAGRRADGPRPRDRTRRRSPRHPS